MTTKLKPCPASPNCVCSDDTDSHHIDAFDSNSDLEVAWRDLRQFLKDDPQTSIISDGPSYIHAESRTSLLHFIDDIEFEFRPELPGTGGIIAVRSASRIGYSDLGTNRRRVEKIRRAIGL